MDLPPPLLVGLWLSFFLQLFTSWKPCSVVGAVGETMMAFVKDLSPNVMKLREKKSSLDLWPSFPLLFALLQHHIHPGV